MRGCESEQREHRSRSIGLRGAWQRIREDVDVVLEKDPAVKSTAEVLLYPHLHALWVYRVAHALYGRGHFLAARMLSLTARAATGIDIHPGARIGRRLFIDHGGAVVIGETAEVGDDVMLYHQVTLGSTGWWTDKRRPAGAPRHPRLRDGVIVGTNASIFGPVTVETNVIVGAHAVVCADVPAGAQLPAGHVHRVEAPSVVGPTLPYPALPEPIPLARRVAKRSRGA